MNEREEPPVLAGTLVRLEPLSLAHAADLEEAAEIDRTAYAYTLVPRAEKIREDIEWKLEKSTRERFLPFAQVRQSDGRAVGCTALGHFQIWPDIPGVSTVEIGWTWLAGSAQRTGLNPESKLLLFDHAFASIGAARVEIKTDARNARSRRAIEQLGATFEGVVRKGGPSFAPTEPHQLRDSAMFSVIAEEWPAVRATLVERISCGRLARETPLS